MLDTNICIELLRTGSTKILARMRRYDIDQIAISSLTLAELQFGAEKSRRPLYHKLLLVQFCAPITVLSFDHIAAECYGMVRAALERKGTPIGPLDTLIASHALALGVTLITNNEREFRRIAGLRIENWIKS
ncbi:MAG: type II toxin-antitoxin system VapC family toxin [Planctomycetota bacterium]|nr:type II toxin-antitoxin system VapC family toxin [Planctomycetota bacterium]